MTVLEELVRDALAPVRDLHVAAILEALAQELSRGGEVEVEPWNRDIDGRIRRDGLLRLPSRGDLRVRRDGRERMRRVQTKNGLDFNPFSGALNERVGISVAPFDWGEVEIRALRGVGGANWIPLRLWCLEWMQPRYGDESEDLSCALHRLDGPHDVAGGWKLCVDLGSAPVQCFEALLTALGQTGCAAFHIGESC
jgi:hypothetical protein